MAPTDPTVGPDLTSYAAVVLAGGRASRLDGFDKAGIEIGGRTLLERALDAVVDAVEVVVVGEQVPTERPVTFTRESPRYGGPVAALLTGRDALLRTPRSLAVVAVDMPRLTTTTLRRLQDAGQGRDGAVLVDADGRHHAVLTVRLDRLDGVRPGLEEQHEMPLRALLARLDLARVPAVGGEERDVDTWADLAALREADAEADADADAG